jgi:hypothetical protein
VQLFISGHARFIPRACFIKRRITHDILWKNCALIPGGRKRFLPEEKNLAFARRKAPVIIPVAKAGQRWLYESNYDEVRSLCLTDIPAMQ